MRKSIFLASLALLPALSLANPSWLYPNPQGPKSLKLTAGKAFIHTFNIQAVASQENTLFIDLYATSLAAKISGLTFSGLAGSGINCSNVNASNNTVTCSGTPTKGTYTSTVTLTISFLGQPTPSTISDFKFIAS